MNIRHIHIINRGLYGFGSENPNPGWINTALDGTNKNNMFISWIGKYNQELADKYSSQEKDQEIQRLEALNTFPVSIESDEEYKKFYEGFCNSILWSHLHRVSNNGNILDIYSPQQDETGKLWLAYKAVNQAFANRIFELIENGTINLQHHTIWVHDYQLMLVPKLIKEKYPQATVAFFLHTPVPQAEICREIPHFNELSKSISAADLVGFQTQEHKKNFAKYIEENSPEITIKDKTRQNCWLQGEEHTAKVGIYPISTNYQLYSSMQPNYTKSVNSALNFVGKGKQLILSIGRADPSKGILQKLEAIKLLLDEMESGASPIKSKDFSLLLQAIPSRQGIAAYKNLQEAINTKVEEINKHPVITKYNEAHLEDIWKPVHLFAKSLASPAEITAFYKGSDIFLETALRDGMNLVSKEFVSVAGPEKVLILSRNAGSAQQLTDAILVNPYNCQEIAAAIKRALLMNHWEKAAKMGELKRNVRNENAKAWRESFIKDTLLFRQSPLKQKLISSYNNSLFAFFQNQTPLQKELLAAQIGFDATIGTLAAKLSGKKLLIISDYDGTIAPFVSNPAKAYPHPQTKKQLMELSKQDAISVLFLTGRSITEFDRLFGASGLDVIGQHGTEKRIDDVTTDNFPNETKQYLETIQKAAELFTQTLREEYNIEPNITLLEIKPHSFAFHWRALEHCSHKEEIITKMQKFLESKKADLGNHNLTILEGDMNFEIKTLRVTKGKAITPILNELQKGTALIFLCDDLNGTDGSAAEKILAHGGYVIQVKNGNPPHKLATHTTTDPAELGDFLKILNNSKQDEKLINNNPKI